MHRDCQDGGYQRSGASEDYFNKNCRNVTQIIVPCRAVPCRAVPCRRLGALSFLVKEFF
ncbi:MAG: hypothetical protein ACK5UY_01030 [Holosporales bacterium]